MKDTNYYRAKGSYSRPGKEAKKAAKDPAFVDAKGPGEEGTDELVNNYTKGTPGQDTNWRTVKEEKKGLWANIHAKRKRIASGSGEKMRKKGDPGAPTPEQLKKSQVKEEIISEEGYDTKRDRDAVMGRSKKTLPGGGGKKPAGYNKADAENAALANIKKMKQFQKEEVDGESGGPKKRNYSANPQNSAARKPVMVNVDGKKVVRMEPEKRNIQTEAALKLRSQNDVRAMLFDFVSEYIDKESMPNLMKLAKAIGKKLKKTGSSFMIESVLDEKTLTSNEKKKREEIAQAMERDNPNMPMDKKMAIATAAAKRVAEMNFHDFRNQLLKEKKECSHCEGKGYHMEDGKKMECPECNGTGMMKESVEQLDELSPATHKSYQAKAFTDGARAMAKKRMGTMSTKDAYEKEKKRHAGIDTSKHLNRMHHGVKTEEVEQVEENNSAPQTAAHRRAMLPKKVKLKGFGPDHAKGNMGNPAARATLGKRMADNEKAREALKDPKHNPSWANSKSRMESVELDENVKKAYEIMKPTMSMDHGIAAIKKHMKVDHNTATNMAKQVMDKVKKGEFKESANLPFEPDAPKPAQKNSDGTKTKPMSVAKMLAKRAMKKKTIGEAKSFDQKFKDHIKFSASKSPAVQAHLKKRAADRDDMNKKNDPNAAKKGYALSAVPPERAYMKARKKGMSTGQARDAMAARAAQKKRMSGKLPK